MKPDHAGVYGMISLVVWTIVLVVSVKYVAFVMRADNQGEGGIMALVALARELPVGDSRIKAMLVAIGILGVALFFGDAEALYADLGHFDRPSIRRGWFFVVFPALLINYLGQGALILADQKAVSTPFFGLMPHWARVPIVVVAVMATMIASQAVITGAFSVTRQAVQLGFLSRMQVRHKSGSERQVYVPTTNWLLYVAVIGLVIGFGSSTALASVYGIGVTGTFVTTTLLFSAVVRMGWHKPPWIVLSGAATFLVIDLAFFSANLTKVPSGGWFPLTVGLLIFIVLTTWQRGRRLVTDKRSQAEWLLRDFVEQLRSMDPPPYRAPGTAVCLSAGKQTTPLALRDNLQYNNVLHEHVVIVSVGAESVPHVGASQQVVVDDLDYTGSDILYLTIRYGFQDKPDVPAALARAAEQGILGDLDMVAGIYFVSEITLVRGDDPGLRPWRKRLFLLLARTSRSPVTSFHLPERRIVTMGSYVELSAREGERHSIISSRGGR